MQELDRYHLTLAEDDIEYAKTFDSNNISNGLRMALKHGRLMKRRTVTLQSTQFMLFGFMFLILMNTMPFFSFMYFGLMIPGVLLVLYGTWIFIQSIKKLRM